MDPLHQLSTVDAAQWRAVYCRAMASGCGRIVHLDAERAAAGDELVALAVPPLARLGVFARAPMSPRKTARACWAGRRPTSFDCWTVRSPPMAATTTIPRPS